MTRLRWAMAGVLVISLLAACSGGSDTSVDAGGTAGGHMSDGGHDMGADGSMLGGVARPADPADAARVVQVQALDELAFDPSVIDVAVGDTIAFEVTNVGAVTHEFVLGSSAMQDQHGDAMDGSDHMMSDAPTAVSLEPGETETIAMRFVREGSLEYGCHVPGHYEGGMVGTVEVRSA